VGREEVNGQEGVWCVDSFLDTKKCRRSSLAHGDSWLSCIAGVQGMEKFTQGRRGGAGL